MLENIVYNQSQELLLFLHSFGWTESIIVF